MDADDRDYGMSAAELEKVVEQLCQSKAQEFALLGYEHVEGKDVWECVNSKYLKNGLPPLHRLVNDIYSLKVTDLMNWMTMQAYKGTPF